MSELYEHYGFAENPEVKRDFEVFEQDPFKSSLTKDSKGKTHFYYTSVDTFHKIFSAGIIHASHTRRMNDWQEFEFGANALIKKILEGFREPKLEDEAINDLGEVKSKILNLKNEKALVKLLEERIKQQAENYEVFNYYKLPTVQEVAKSVAQEHIFIEPKEDKWKLERHCFGSKSDLGNHSIDYASPERYSISFTQKGDLLYLWKMYAQESGVAIEFNFNNKVKKLRYYQNVIEEGKGTRMGFGVPCKPPQSIFYGEENNEEMEQIFQNLTETGLDLKNIFAEAVFFKHQGFEAEAESRLVFAPYKYLNEGKVIHSKLGYRLNDHVLIPYLEISCADAEDPKKIGWPIVSLTVGPGYNQDVVFESLIHFVEFGDNKSYEFDKEEKRAALITYYAGFFSTFLPREEGENEEAHYERARKEIGRRIKPIEDLNELENAIFTLCYEQYTKYKQNGKKTGTEFEDSFNEYRQKNYFSLKRGIIIKKSSIPYIFN